MNFHAVIPLKSEVASEIFRQKDLEVFLLQEALSRHENTQKEPELNPVTLLT